MSDETDFPLRIDAKGRSRSVRRPSAPLDRALMVLAGRQHGVVARRQLVELGFGKGAIEGRVRRGLLRSIHRGVYRAGPLPLAQEGRWMAAVLAIGPGSLLSHRSAGQLWGVLPRKSSPAEVSSRSKVGPAARRARLVVHHGHLPTDEIDERDGIPVTSVFRTIFDLAAVLPKRQLERALHEAEVQRLTDRLSLPALLARHPGRRGAANLRALLASRDSVGITQNDLEELFVALLDRHGLPRPQLNGTLAVRGRLLKPDCMWREQRLIVELDGGAVHRTHRAFEADRQRDRILLAEGWRSLRVTWRQLRDEPGAIAADLDGLLRRPAPPPTL